MKLIVAGRDRSADLGARVEAEAGALPATAAPRIFAPSHTALRLRNCADEREFLAAYLRLLRHHLGLEPAGLPVPRPPGPAGALLAAVRRGLWRILGYQQERLAARQTAVNELLAGAVDFVADAVAKLPSEPGPASREPDP